MIRKLLTASLLVLTAAAPALAMTDEAWRPYEDVAERFTIEFPRGWKVARDPFRILVATSPEEHSADAFHETIKVVATDVAPGLSLDAYYQNSLDVYRSIWRVHGAASGAVGGAKARRAVIDQTIGHAKTRLLKCFVLGEGKIFVITCASDPAGFDQHVPVFEAALATFKIHPRPAVPSFN